MPSRDDRHERKALLKLRTGFSERFSCHRLFPLWSNIQRGSLNTVWFAGQFSLQRAVYHRSAYIGVAGSILGPRCVGQKTRG